MRLSTHKKSCIILAILIVASIAVVLLRVFFFNDDSSENNQKQYEVTTSLNDKFLIWEKLLTQFPDYSYDIEIFDDTNSKKQSILKLDNVEKDSTNGEIGLLFSNDDIKVYSYLNYIIYKEKSNYSFKSLWIGKIEKLDPVKYRCFIPVAKEIISKDWKRARSFSEFLIKANDSKAINTIKRYANGEFTLEEIENNEYSGYSEDEMKEYFKGLLLKYNIKISTKDK